MNAKKNQKKSKEKNYPKRFLAYLAPTSKTNEAMKSYATKMVVVITKKIICVETIPDKKNWIKISHDAGNPVFLRTSLTKFLSKFPLLVRAADNTLIRPKCVWQVSTPHGLGVLFLRGESWTEDQFDIPIKTGERYRDHLRIILPQFVDFDM